MVKNRFLRTADLNDPEMKRLKVLFDKYYVTAWRGTPHPWGSKNPKSIVTHWSREWEYPWAIISADTFEQGENILDCGCGGAPLLPFIVEYFKCNGVGIDRRFGERLKKMNNIKLSEPLANLRHFYVDPSCILGSSITIKKQSMTDIKYPDEFFDKVFCISVIEHMEKAVVEKSMKEMVRVLKPGGKLLMTIDHTSHKGHVKPCWEGKFKEIIKMSGLELDGESDFSVPGDNEVHGYYHVVGFVLKKG